MAYKKKEKEEEKEPEQEEAPNVRVASHDMFLYHKTEPARIFKRDEVIPEGWQDHPETTKA